MVVRGTSIIDIGGVAGCRNACEDKRGQELKHACKRRDIMQSITTTLLCPTNVRMYECDRISFV